MESYLKLLEEKFKLGLISLHHKKKETDYYNESTVGAKALKYDNKENADDLKFIVNKPELYLQSIITQNVMKNTDDTDLIKNWVMFLGWIQLIGVISAIIVVINN